MRCTAFLNLQNRPDSGLTVILSPRWMCVIPFTQPYCTAPNGNPVYLDGFDFAGLMTLQSTDVTWPATAGLEDQTITISQALAASVKQTTLADEETISIIGNINTV